MSEIKSIELNEKQMAVQSELMKFVLQIESNLITVIDTKQPDMVTEQLANLIPLTGITGQIMEKAKMIYDWSLGQAAMELMNNELLRDARQQVISAYLKGRTAKQSGLYERANQACTKLDSAIMGLQSILKIATAEMNLSRFQQG